MKLKNVKVVQGLFLYSYDALKSRIKIQVMFGALFLCEFGPRVPYSVVIVLKQWAAKALINDVENDNNNNLSSNNLTLIHTPDSTSVFNHNFLKLKN